MKDIIKILIFALALVGLVTLIVHCHWLGAIGVAGAVVTATKLLVKRNGDWEESTIEAKNNGSWN